MLAAQADGTSRLTHLSTSDDTCRLRFALNQLGVKIVEAGPETWDVHGLGQLPQVRGIEVDVGAGGSTLRFLTAWLAAGQTDVFLYGEPALFARPQEPLWRFLEQEGTTIEKLNRNGRPGIRIQGRGFRPGDWRPPIQPSSQYLSGLLLAAGNGGTRRVFLPDYVPSAGYVDLTVECMHHFCGPSAVVANESTWTLNGMPPQACEYAVPGDPSGATFFLVALILMRQAARIVEPWSTVHPEARLFRRLFDHELLQAGQEGFSATGNLPDQALEFDLDDAPDAGPALAVLGAYLPRGLILKNIARLRHKESDRVAGMQQLLDALDRPWELHQDTLRILSGSAPQAQETSRRISCRADHRMAMAAGIAALRAPWLQVDDPQCVTKSFPDFWVQRNVLLDSKV